jgi:hypothetical protein
MSYKGREAALLIEGKTIKNVKMHSFDDGYGDETYAPVFTFEDGSSLQFLVENTEDESGVNLLYIPKVIKP